MMKVWRTTILCASMSVLTLGAISEASRVSFFITKINNIEQLPNTTTANVCPGDIIEFDIMGSEWSPNGERLRLYQVDIDPESYFNAGILGLLPINFGAFDSIDVTQRVEGAFIDFTRPDYVYFSLSVLSAVDISTLSYRYGSLLQQSNMDSPLYEGTPKYLGTLIVEVLPGSGGTFTFTFKPSFVDPPIVNTIFFDLNTVSILPMILEQATINVTSTLLCCGNGLLNFGEECDGGIACTDCLCDSGFESTIPLSFDCQSICGNGSLDSGEECDGGLDCTDCLCDMSFEPTVSPSLDCQSICGNGNLDLAEECDGGFSCIACECELGFESTDPLSFDCQSTCGNGIVDPGEECDGLDDIACPGACLSDCTCLPPPQVCGDNVVNQSSEVCDGTDDDACPGQCDENCQCTFDVGQIPTVSKWGLIVMALLLLTGTKVMFGWRQLQDLSA